MAGDLSRDLASLRIERDAAEGGGTRGRWPLWLGGALAALALLGGGGLLASRVLARPAVTVGQVVTISPAQADVKLMTTGYVVPLRRALVASKLVARIASITVAEGDQVKEGQVIAELEATDFRATVAEARALLRTAEARVVGARAALDEARLALGREKTLFASGASSQAVLDGAQVKFEMATAGLAAALADVESAQARLENAQSILASTKVTAPFAGRVVRKMAEIGEVPAGTIGGTAAIVELVDFDTLVVEADVSEGRIAQVRVGGPAEISLDAYPTRRLRGQVSEIRPTVDRQKATVLTRIKFVDPVEGVLPQMAAKVLLLGSELSAESLREPAKVVVPRSAVTERAGAAFVFVVSDGRVRLTPVTLGAVLGESRELTSGPEPGSRVVLDPPASLADGDRIKEKV